MPHPTVRCFLAAPWVARAVVDLHVEFGLLLELDQRTADLIGLVVSQENSCRFCCAIVRSTLWLQGMDAERIRRVERMPEQALLRLLRPLLDGMMNRHRSRGQPAALPAADPALPNGALVAAFAGSPIAAALQRTLAEMRASTQLSRRCKLLMFAVVSRGLPCRVCELELTAALRREGLSADAVERILGRLDGPELDATERALLPLARESLWCEPAQPQRRVRGLSGTLTQPQLIEAIGVAAMANALCRMSAVVLAAPDT